MKYRFLGGLLAFLEKDPNQRTQLDPHPNQLRIQNTVPTKQLHSDSDPTQMTSYIVTQQSLFIGSFRGVDSRGYSEGEVLVGRRAADQLVQVG